MTELYAHKSRSISTVERRKLQNRIAQRKLRDKKKSQALQAEKRQLELERQLEVYRTRDVQDSSRAECMVVPSIESSLERPAEPAARVVVEVDDPVSDSDSAEQDVLEPVLWAESQPQAELTAPSTAIEAYPWLDSTFDYSGDLSQSFGEGFCNDDAAMSVTCPVPALPQPVDAISLDLVSSVDCMSEERWFLQLDMRRQAGMLAMRSARAHELAAEKYAAAHSYLISV